MIYLYTYIIKLKCLFLEKNLKVAEVDLFVKIYM